MSEAQCRVGILLDGMGPMRQDLRRRSADATQTGSLSKTFAFAGPEDLFGCALCFPVGFLANSRGPRGICHNRSPGNLPIDIEPQEFARNPMRKHKAAPGCALRFPVGFLANSRGPRGICYNRSPGKVPINRKPQEFARNPMRKHKAHPGALCVFL